MVWQHCALRSMEGDRVLPSDPMDCWCWWECAPRARVVWEEARQGRVMVWLH